MHRRVPKIPWSYINRDNVTTIQVTLQLMKPHSIDTFKILHCCTTTKMTSLESGTVRLVENLSISFTSFKRKCRHAANKYEESAQWCKWVLILQALVVAIASGGTVIGVVAYRGGDRNAEHRKDTLVILCAIIILIIDALDGVSNLTIQNLFINGQKMY